MKRGGEDVRLGSFATAEEAAQCVARSPEGQAAAEQAAASSSHAVQRPPVLMPPLIRLLLISLRGLGGSKGWVVVMLVGAQTYFPALLTPFARPVERRRTRRWRTPSEFSPFLTGSGCG